MAIVIVDHPQSRANLLRETLAGIPRCAEQASTS